MSNLSDLLPAGAGAKVATFTADGTLPSGQAVALQSDGTVKVISSSSVSESLGSAVQIDGGSNTYGPMAAFDSTNNKVVVVYRADSGGYLTAVAGTVSGSSITFGTALTLHSVQARDLAIEYNVNQDAFLVTYDNSSSSNYLFAVGVTITSGTTLSAGTPTSMNSSSHRFGEIAYNSTTYDMFCIYSDGSADLDYRVVTMTGTSLSIGSANAINGSNNHYNGAAVAYCPHQERMLVVFCDGSDNDDGEYRMYSASGSTYTSVASGTYESTTNAINPDIVHIGNSQFVVGHRNDDSYPNWDGEFYVATIASSSVTFGTKLQYENMQTLGLTYDSNADKVVVQFDKLNDSSKGYYGVGTVSGTGASATISFDTAVVFHSDGSIEADYVRMQPTFDSNSNKVILVYRNRTDTEGNVNVLTLASTSSNSGDFIGITNQAISDSASGEVAVQGGTITNSSLLPSVASATFGSEVVYEEGATNREAIAYDTGNDKIVVAYRDEGDSNKGKALVGTVSGTSISFGTAVEFNSGATQYTRAVYDPDQGKVVITYTDVGNSGHATAIVGTVSGTSISFGSETVFEAAPSVNLDLVYDTNNDKVVAVYLDEDNSNYGTAIVGTVSGTSISFGSPVVFNSVGTNPAAAVFDSTNNKILIAYRSHSPDDNSQMIVGTVSGTSISFGSATVYVSGQSYNQSLAHDTSSGKNVLVYRDSSNSSYGTALVATISGTSVSAGSTVVFNAASTLASDVTYDPITNSTFVFYKDGGNSDYGTVKGGTVSGTDISFGSASVWNTGNPGGTIASVKDPDQDKIVIAYVDYGNSQKGTAIVATLTNASPALTIGSTYYVQDDGTLSTTSSSVTAGKALSGTTLLLNG